LSLKHESVAGNYGIVFILFLLLLIFSTLAPSFMSIATIVNISRQIATIGICAVGMTFVMLSGGIDFSIGSLLALINIVCAKLIVEHGINPINAVLICFIIAVIVGSINAFWITVVNIPPLITTLGMMTILRGLAYVLSGGHAIWGFSNTFRAVGRGYIGVFPIPFIIMFAMFIFGWFFLTRTRFGRFVYGIGGSESAAKQAGINVTRMKYFVYVICSVLTALAGILLLSRLNAGLPKTGSGLEMEVVTAVVLGGVSIYGGKGSIVGVFLEVVIMGVLTNGMTYLNVTEHVQLVIRGLVLLVAIGLDNISKKAHIS